MELIYRKSVSRSVEKWTIAGKFTHRARCYADVRWHVPRCVLAVNCVRSGAWMRSRFTNLPPSTLSHETSELFRILATVRSSDIVHQRTPVISPSSVVPWTVRISIRCNRIFPSGIPLIVSNGTRAVQNSFWMKASCLLPEFTPKGVIRDTHLVDSCRFDEQIALITNEGSNENIYALRRELRTN